MNIFISGQKYFGEAIFCDLLDNENYNIVGVSSPKEDRLRRASQTNDIPYFETGTWTVDDFPSDVDLIVSAHGHDIIKKEIIDLTNYGAIGYHPSLLPLYRGKNAVQATINNKDKVTGGTVYYLTDEIDAGRILHQKMVFVSEDETIESLWVNKLCPLGIDMLLEVVRDFWIVGEGMEGTEQQHKYATYC